MGDKYYTGTFEIELTGFRYRDDEARPTTLIFAEAMGNELVQGSPKP